MTTYADIEVDEKNVGDFSAQKIKCWQKGFQGLFYLYIAFFSLAVLFLIS